MLSLTLPVRIFLCMEPTDMRRGFDRLAATAYQVTQQDPLSGHLFVFINRRKNRVKILYWDKSGYCLWYKRLEKGCFHLPQSGCKQDHIELDTAGITLMLEGIDLAESRRYKRFSLPQKNDKKV